MVHREIGSQLEGSICLVHGNISNERWKGAHLSYISVTTKAAWFFNQISSQEILPRASPTPELLYFFLPAADYFENNLPAVLMTPEPCHRQHVRLSGGQHCHRQHVSRLGSFSKSPTASLSCWPQLYPAAPLFVHSPPARIHSSRCSEPEYKAPWPAPRLDRVGSREGLAQVHAGCVAQSCPSG